MRRRKTVVMAILLGACPPQRDCLHVDRQGRCCGWLCGFKNAPQIRRQQVSCTFGGVLFLHKAARETSQNFQSANRSERSSSHLQAECEPNWILLSAAEEAKLQECSCGPEGRDSSCFKVADRAQIKLKRIADPLFL